MGNKQYLVDDMNSHNYDSVNLMSFEEEMKKFRNSIGDSEKKNIHNFIMYLKIFSFILILRIAIRLGE